MTILLTSAAPVRAPRLWRLRYEETANLPPFLPILVCFISSRGFALLGEERWGGGGGAGGGGRQGDS